MPVQRIPRYILLLTSLAGKTDKSHPDYANITAALEKIRSITDSVNDSIKQADKIRNLHELVAQVRGLAVS